METIEESDQLMSRSQSSSNETCSEESPTSEGRKRPKVIKDEDMIKANIEVDDNNSSDSSEVCDALAPVFVSQYHVVKHIFEYLRLVDVLQTALVNKQWAEIGQRVRKQRKNLPFTVLYHPYIPEHKLAFEYFNGFEVSEEAQQLIRSESRGRQPVKSWKNPALPVEAGLLVRKVFLGAYDESQLMIAFGTSAFDKSLTAANNRREDELKERMELIFGDIQNHVPCISSFSCGLVVTLPDICKALEMENNTFPCLSCLAIPKVQGLQVKMFNVTHKQNKKLKGRVRTEEIRDILGIEKEKEDKLKGIVLLQKVTYRTAPLIAAILHYIRTKPNVALGGGIHESVLLTGTPDDNVLAGGMLIYGEDNVRVSSIALQETKISTNNQSKIDQLKASMIPDGRSFAIMFACNGRGVGMHGRPNVEADLFNAHFPTTPLVGAFTLGEFCNEVISTGTNAPVEPPKRIDFAYTTVFVMVSYKHISETQDSK
ncbi:F-box only protein 22 [Orchesella cincta]|uniref:F-box only protein 22 n=1 Tax=Orchesella cincta TaxID=48709 RepID=A0A1D2NHE8_ORCCI|nr:F-box only protein 22 [Orchesella cincta]